jgi:hypothetical protein
VVVAPNTPSPVIVCEHPDVVQRFSVDPARAESMVNSCILKLTSASDLGTAWTRLGITPQDIVGIKITTAGGQLMSTHRPIIRAIISGLHAAGVPLNHIILWDKNSTMMVQAGFPPSRGTANQVPITCVYPDTGYDPIQTYVSELSGTLIWGDSEFIKGSPDDMIGNVQTAIDKQFPGHSAASHVSEVKQASNASHYANLVTHVFTKIVNVPVITDCPGLGLNGCLASLALACVDNNRRFQGDPTYGDPAIGEILSRDFIRKKVVLTVADAMIVQFAGGPEFDPEFCEPIGAVYVGRDPVAIDALILPRIESWRKHHQVDPLGNTAAHIHGCTYSGIGTDDPHRIQFIQIP